MKEIPLYNKGSDVVGYAQVDDEDYDSLMQYRWYMHNGYPSRIQRIYMHREVMSAGEYDGTNLVDHKNRTPTDCTKENLRVGNQTQNMQNRVSQKGSRSKYIGVDLYKNKKWRARVSLNGSVVCLGYYEDEDEAGKVVAEFRRDNLPFSQEAMKCVQ